MNDKKYKTKFEKEWGSSVASGGYVQIPHDLLRNIGKLEISSNEFAILAIIMGYEKGKLIPAVTIADHLGISVGTVRNAFRNLDKKRYLHRFFQTGDANKFSYRGIQEKVDTLSKNRYPSIQKSDIRIDRFSQGYDRNLYTNKEYIKTNNKLPGDGFARFHKSRQELKNRKNR